ncbi:MAG: hypothetical protein ACE5FU_09170 [Nitrospinota bacterium]
MDTIEETVAEPEKETAESTKIEAAVEATELQEKKSAQKQRKRKKRKRKPKKCGALTAKGTPCTFKVSANGRGGRHQGVPDTPPEAFLNEDKAAAPQTSPGKEEKTGTLKYATYIISLMDEGEEEVFNEFFSQFYKDFTLNSSSDRMNCEIACIYYVKLLQAIKNDDTETASKFDRLLKNKIEDLKASDKK